MQDHGTQITPLAQLVVMTDRIFICVAALFDFILFVILFIGFSHNRGRLYANVGWL